MSHYVKLRVALVAFQELMAGLSLALYGIAKSETAPCTGILLLHRVGFSICVQSNHNNSLSYIWRNDPLGVLPYWKKDTQNISSALVTSHLDQRQPSAPVSETQIKMWRALAGWGRCHQQWGSEFICLSWQTFRWCSSALAGGHTNADLHESRN